jgi:hypothetical protein
MARSTTRCASCPAAKKTHNNPLMRPLFLEEGISWPSDDVQSKRQERALREAIAPYLCIADLRHLATRGESLWKALRNIETIPEDVQALLSLLQVLLTPGEDDQIEKPADLAPLLMLEMGHLDHEEFWEVCLDTKNHVQRIHRLYKGTLNSSVIRVCELFRLPLLLNSASIIVAHNHPSGTTQASPEDIDATQSLIKAGEVLQIEVLDHVIIGRGAWMSMREHRLGW